MRARRTTFALLSLAGAAVLLTGCGGGATKDEHAPVVCREGQAVILDALPAAPGEVILAGETPISGCLVTGAGEGELADFGEVALAAATKLNAAARADPGGRANLELGYLLGAIARGSADTEGVHAELLRRLSVAARFAPRSERLSQRFLTTYEKGFAAGRDHG
jgi:hypothetical protein